MISQRMGGGVGVKSGLEATHHPLRWIQMAEGKSPTCAVELSRLEEREWHHRMGVAIIACRKVEK